MNSKTLKLGGDIGNTPLTLRNNDNYIQEATQDIRTVFDWCSITFEDFDIKKINNNFYLDNESQNILNAFLNKIGFKNGIENYKKIPGNYGFSVGYQLDEHIKLYYGGNNIKSSENRYLCQLEFTGQGCREFETYHNGSWKILFQEIKKMRYYNFPRIDTAIDDFKGIYDIYKIENKINSGEVITPFLTKNYYKSFFGNNTKGYTIELGTRGKNQVVIYDKNLERKAKELTDENTTVWYRYEIRLTDDKAKELVDQYLLSCDNENFSFGRFISEILFSFLDIKIKDREVRKYDWPTDPDWIKLLEVASKNKLSLEEKPPSTIEKKRKWYENMETTNAELFLTSDNFVDFILSNILNGLSNLKDINMHRIKNYYSNMGIEFSDEKINEYIGKIANKKISLIDNDTGEIIGVSNELNILK